MCGGIFASLSKEGCYFRQNWGEFGAKIGIYTEGVLES